MRQISTLTVLSASLVVSLMLGACGTRGPLTLPPQAKATTSPEAGTGQTKPSTDLSTAKESTR